MKKNLICIVSLTLALLAGKANAQSSPYFNAVTNLNPAGYWPLHEVEAPASGNIETNYGSLGVLGNGYYPDYQVKNGAFIRQTYGALANDADSSVFFTGPAGGGNATNGLFVPHTSPLTTLIPPFTLECWFMATNIGSGQGDILSQADGSKTVGLRLYYQNSVNDPVNLLSYNGSTSGTMNFTTSSQASNQWHHLVLTCDANTNMSAWWDGLQVNGPTSFVGKYKPDTHIPFTVGQGLGNQRAFHGLIDEVAVYTNVITDIYQHYSDGLSGAPGAYFQDVTNDNPVIYLRMDSLDYTAPDASTWPVLVNYGQTNGVPTGNGVYNPGTIPGIVVGTSYPNFPLGFTGTSVPLFSGVSSFADAGFAPAYNPTGGTPFTVSAVFRGNPTDTNRVQSIVGHGANSWELGLGVNGYIVFNSGTNSTTAVATGTAPGDLVSTTTAYDDGQWHQVVAVHNGTSNVLYVDGVANKTNVVVANNVGNSLHVLIGSDPSYTNTPIGLGRQFAGQVCDVAFFTNALNADQVQALYNASGIPPTIVSQPATGRAVNGGVGTSISFAVGASGGTPFVYHWYFNTTASYAGATALADDGAHYYNSATSQLTVSNLIGADSGYYFAVVANNFGSVTSALASLTVYSMPSIASQTPVTYTNLFTLFAGANPAFSVTANGAQPIYYYWFTNGVVDTAATSSNFIWTNVQTGNLSIYCIASNFAGSVTSSEWDATVVAAPTAPYPLAVLADMPVGYWRLNEPDVDGYNNGVLAEDYAGGNNGIYTNTVLGMGTYSQATDPGTTSASFGADSPRDNDAYGIYGIDFASPSNTSPTFSLEAWVSGQAQGKDAGIVSKGAGNGGEQFNLDTGSDTIATHGYRFLVRDANGGVHAASSPVMPTYGVWHHLVGVCDESNGFVTLYVDGVMSAQTTIAHGAGILSSPRQIIIGSRPSNGTVTNNDSQFIGNISDVAVYNYALTANQVATHYVQSGQAPVFAQSPSNTVTAVAMTTLTLPATLVGTPPLGYQWYDSNNGTNIVAGTTNSSILNASLTISNVPANWNGNTLQLTVTNPYGSTSVSVYLQVSTSPPMITRDLPTSLALSADRTYTLTVGVQGTPPIGYQWYQQGVAIPGQVGPTLIIPTANPGDTASYQVVLSNAYGTATSAVCVVTRYATPVSTYASSIMSLNPAGYWPLQETNNAAPTAIETNYGTLGQAANAFYAATNVNNVTFSQGGALTGAGDNDSAVYFNSDSLTSQTITNVNSYAFVPRSIPGLTLRPPLSMECWVNSSFTTFGDMFAEGGGTGLDAPSGQGNFGGFRMSWGGTATGANLQLYVANGNGTTRNAVSSPANSISLGQWHHLVATYDGTTTTIYIDGEGVTTNSTTLAGANTMAPDTWSPFTIGGGFWQNSAPARGFNGTLDEVAVYTNILTANQVSSHYQAGTSGGNYFNTILNDAPLLYYRLDAPAFIDSPASLYPSAVNLGTSPVPAVYQRGIQPGGIAGPVNSVLAANTIAAPMNGVFSAVDAGYDAAFDPSGTQPFSVLAWFKGNPADGRAQAIVSHGATNWALNLDGTTGRVVWNLYNAGQVTSTGILNDGNWHFAAGVYDGAKSYLYVDGSLNNSATASGSLVSEPGAHLYLGGNADYTLSGSNERFLAGAISQVAVFTNALSAEQIQSLYATVQPTPTISISTSGNHLVITYTGTLLSAPNVNGPYQPVADASSPYTVPTVGGQAFYRSRNP